MTFLNEQDNWEPGIRQLETSDPVAGGPDGVDNIGPRQLANRTRYLLRRLIDGFLSYALDTGTKNNIVANLPQAVDQLVDGMEIRVRVAIANDNKCTLTPNGAAENGIAPLPLYGGDGAELAGGELFAGAGIRARLDMALNGGAGAWVIQSITRGIARAMTPPVGDKSTMVANMAALFSASNGREVVDVSPAGSIVLTKAQYGVAMLSLTGALAADKDLVFPADRTGQWIIENSSTGNKNITARVAGGAGVVLPIGTPVIVCSDGAAIKFASAGGQASLKPFSFTGVAGASITIPGGYTPGALIVQRNGANQEPGTSASPDFTATDGVNVVFSTALAADEYVTVWVFATFNLANAVQKSGDVMGGPLALYQGSTVPAPEAGDRSTKIPNTAWVGANTPGRFLNVQVLAASALYTPTPGMRFAIVEVQGSGAGTGGAPATGAGGYSGSSGASSGSYARVLLTAAQIGANQPVTVNPGGTAGAVGSSIGGNGGTVSFGNLISCPGGNGSASYGPTATALNVQAPAALAALPTITAGVILAQTRGNQGGPAIGGTAGGVIAGTGSVSPINGSMSGPGAGAGGTAVGANAAAQAGFAGAAGEVIVWEYL